MTKENKKPVKEEKIETKKETSEKPLETIEKKVKQDIKEKVEKAVKEKVEKKQERTYIIPLREKCRSVPRYKKTNKAVKTVKEFLARHMKLRDRDLKKVRLDSYLNQFLWQRGIKNPPSKVKVKAYLEGDLVRAELVEMPKALKARKLREEKIEIRAAESVKKKKVAEKPAEKPKEDLEKKAEEKEKKSAVVEAGKEMEKAAAKQMKHTAKKQQKAPVSQKMSLQR